MRNDVKSIILDEFSKLICNMENDFIKNYNKKSNNFLLNQLSSSLVASMVFVSSFESKSGNAIEQVAQRIARLKFGEENVPKVIDPKGLLSAEQVLNLKGQWIVTNVNMENEVLKGDIASFRAKHMAVGSGKNRIESGVTMDNLKANLYPLGDKYKDGEVHKKPVDLAFKDETGCWNIFELKAGGDLDSSNAPSNIEKLLNIYVGLNDINSHVYFGTLYNKDGEGNTWKGTVKKHLNYPTMFLIGKDFWEKILPETMDFNEFVNLYKECLSEIDLSNRIDEMLNKVNR